MKYKIIPHSKSMSSLDNLPPELIHKILLYTQYSDIINYCSINYNAWKLFHDTYFWLKKLDYDMSSKYDIKVYIPSKYIIPYAIHLSYKRWFTKLIMLSDQLYIELEFSDISENSQTNDDSLLNTKTLNVQKIYESIQDDDIIAFLLDQYPVSNHELNNIIKYAAMHNSIPILDKINSINSSICINPKYANIAIIHGNINVLNWFEAHNVLPNSDNIYPFSYYGHTQVLDWLEARGFVFTLGEAQAAVQGGSTSCLIWLAERGILPNVIDTHIASQCGHLDVLIWLVERGGIVNNEVANIAAMNARINVLQWLELLNIYPDSEAFKYLMTHHDMDIDTLRWLNAHGIQLTQEYANKAAKMRKIDVLQYLESINILPDHTVIDDLIRKYNDNIHVLEWLVLRGILPNQNHMDIVGEIGNLSILIWLESIGINPTWYTCDLAVEYGNLNIVQYLVHKSILPTQPAINSCERNRHSAVLDFLSQYKLKPFDYSKPVKSISRKVKKIPRGKIV